MALVRTWILEHAVKFQMNRVVSALMKQDPGLVNMKLSERGSHEPPVNPISLVKFLCGNMLKNIEIILEKPVTVDVLHTIDIETLSVCAEVLKSLYTQDHFMDFKTFYKVFGALKLLFIILLLVRGASNTLVMENLDLLFPACTQANMLESSLQFGLDEQMSKVHQQREKDARLFVLQLLLKESKRDEYMRKRMLTEVSAFLRCIRTIFPQIIKAALDPYIQETVIEKISLGKTDVNVSQNDPAVKLLFEFVQPGFQEDDLISAVEMLDSSEIDTINTFLSECTEIVPALPAVRTGRVLYHVEEPTTPNRELVPLSGSNVCAIQGSSEETPSKENISDARLKSKTSSSGSKTRNTTKRSKFGRPKRTNTVSPGSSSKKSPRRNSSSITPIVKKCSVMLHFNKDFTSDIGEFALFK